MILRSIHIEHWRGIGRLALDQLPGGIVVLHGPNRTGKSSLVKALRACLFDFDHDSASKDLKNSFPLNGNGPPKIAIEFETGGERYRITKVFSKNRDGLARLEREEGGRWQVVEESKEASRKTRELLGADKSTLGANQLLWLGQGEVALPDAVDASLKHRLVGVLGMLVTGRDLKFKQALDERCKKWFTPAKGDFKKDSSVFALEQRRKEREKEFQDLEEQFREAEQVIRALHECEDRLPEYRKAFEEADQELTRLKAEREQSVVRREQYKQAAGECQAAERNVQEARRRLEALRKVKERCEVANQEVHLAEAALRFAEAEKERTTLALEEKALALQTARQRMEETQRCDVQEIQDRRTLLQLEEQRTRLEKAKRLHADVAELEKKIQTLTAPDALALDMLRANRREADKLRSQLQAETLALSVTLRCPFSIQLKIDGEASQTIELPAEEKQRWQLRQWAALELPGLASIEVARSQENLDLEQAARKLAELDRVYREAILSFKEDPADEACLDRLTERRLEREASVARLNSARQELQQSAPLGVGTLETELERLLERRQAVLERCPTLADWRPDKDDLTEREQACQKRLSELQQAAATAEKEQQAAEKALKKAEAGYQDCRGKCLEAKTTAKNAQEEMARHEDEPSLASALKQAEEALSAARQRLQEAELTEAEKAIDQRCEKAEYARKMREGRFRDLEAKLHQLHGNIESKEGLHLRRADAEAALKEVEKALTREKLEAGAYKRLQDHFDRCRDHQVQQIMGPIADRVLVWAKDLGLDEYHEVRFGENYLLKEVLRRDGDLNVTMSLDEDSESYGTVEQLNLLVRLALGGVLAKDEATTTILDDPLAHADPAKHRRILDILRLAAEGNRSWTPPAGPLQIVILTCHPDRFDYLPGAHHIDLAAAIQRGAGHVNAPMNEPER